MDKIKILHCADIHIGALSSFLGASSSQRRHETLRTFERMIDISIEQDVQLFIISGDLFDTNNIDKSFYEPVFEKIASADKIIFIFAAGNHDPLSTDSPFIKYNQEKQLPKNLYCLGTRDSVFTFDDLKCRVYGKSFGSVYQKGTEHFSITPPIDDYINIMAIHGDCRSDLASDYNSITPDFIKSSKMDYIALGHVHKASDIMNIGETFFSYPGCPEGQGFDELDDKGVYMGYIGKNECDLRFQKTCQRMHIALNLNVSECNSNQDINEIIINTLKEDWGDNYKDNLYKISLTGQIQDSISIAIPEILSHLSSEVFFAKIKDLTDIKIDYEMLSKEISLKGIFVKNMLEKIETSEDIHKEDLKKAMILGLKAFNSEVIYNDN